MVAGAPVPVPVDGHLKQVEPTHILVVESQVPAEHEPLLPLAVQIKLERHWQLAEVAAYPFDLVSAAQETQLPPRLTDLIGSQMVQERATGS